MENKPFTTGSRTAVNFGTLGGALAAGVSMAVGGSSAVDGSLAVGGSVAVRGAVAAGVSMAVGGSLAVSGSVAAGSSLAAEQTLRQVRTRRPASADKTACRQFQATGQPVSRTQASDPMTSRLPRYDAKCVQCRCFQCGSVPLDSDITVSYTHLTLPTILRV